MRWKIYDFIKPKKEFKIQVIDIEFNKNITVDFEIDFYNASYNFLKRSIYEFLYNFNEKEKNIKVYILLKNPNDYLVLGKEN